MIVSDLIKENADKNFKLYEDNINNYYNNYQRNFNTNCLTDYIYRFYIQADYSAAHEHKYDSITSIHKYINNLYSSYYNYYKKEGMKYIITKKIIDDILLKDNTIEYLTVKYIVDNTGYDKNIEDFLKASIESTKTLPKFALWEVNKNNVYVFLAILLDYIL